MSKEGEILRVREKSLPDFYTKEEMREETFSREELNAAFS